MVNHIVSCRIIAGSFFSCINLTLCVAYILFRLLRLGVRTKPWWWKSMACGSSKKRKLMPLSLRLKQKKQQTRLQKRPLLEQPRFIEWKKYTIFSSWCANMIWMAIRMDVEQGQICHLQESCLLVFASGLLVFASGLFMIYWQYFQIKKSRQLVLFVTSYLIKKKKHTHMDECFTIFSLNRINYW